MSRRRSFVTCVVVVGLAACSSSHTGAPSASSTSAVAPGTTAPATTTPRPSGPAAVLTALTGGHGVYIGEGSTVDLKRAGYAQHEYFAAGTATSYKPTGALTHNGRWTFVPGTRAPYRTRVLVRAPADPKAFSGTVVVEWLNVSGGVDADPDWVSLHEEIVRAGDAWVGVSAQRIGVEGGPVLVSVKGIPGADQAGKGLKKIDPARATARWRTRVTALRTTSLRKSPVRSAPAPG